MNWKPIVAGVDDSPEGLIAAQAALALASKAGVPCHLVHAIQGWDDPSLPRLPEEDGWRRLILDAARAIIVDRLNGSSPPAVLDQLELRFGRTSTELAQVADRLDAQLIVIGGKHHSALGRWFAGSTAHDLVRSHDRPILIACAPRRGGPAVYRRVLAAVDQSDAARLTADGAERFARLYDARLRAIHVIEPPPIIPDSPIGFSQDYLRRSEDETERTLWPLFTFPNAERQLREGHAPETIIRSAIEWEADLLVVASHGRGWIDRILIGSVTEQILQQLPCSVLVMPATVRPQSTTAREPERSVDSISTGSLL